MECDETLNFCDLPTEMRWKILGYVHAEESNSENWKTWNNKRLVCRQMKNDIDNGFGIFVSWSSDCPFQHIEIPKLTSKVCRVTMNCRRAWMESFPSVLDLFRKNLESIKELSWILYCNGLVLSALLQLTVNCPNLKKLCIDVRCLVLSPLDEENWTSREFLFPKLTSLRLVWVRYDNFNADQVIFYLMRTLLLPKISHFELNMFGNTCHKDLTLMAYQHLFGFLQKHTNSMTSLHFFINMDLLSLGDNESNLKQLLEYVDSLKGKLFLQRLHFRFLYDHDIIDQSIFGTAIKKFVMQQAPTLVDLSLGNHYFPPNVYFPNLRKLRLFLVSDFVGPDVVVKLYPRLNDLRIFSHRNIIFYPKFYRFLLKFKNRKR